MAEDGSLPLKAPTARESNSSRSSIDASSTQTGLRLTRMGITRSLSSIYTRERAVKRPRSSSSLDSNDTARPPSSVQAPSVVQSRPQEKAQEPSPVAMPRLSLAGRIAARFGIGKRKHSSTDSGDAVIAMAADEPSVCPPVVQPRAPPATLPPGITVSVKGTAEYARVADLLSEELSGKAAFLPFQYLVCDAAVAKEAQSKKPRRMRNISTGSKLTKEHYFWTQETVNGLYSVQAPTAVFEKTPAGDYRLLFAVVDNACEDPTIAKVLGEGNEALVDMMVAKGCVVTAPGRAALGAGKRASTNLLAGVMISAGLRLSTNPTCQTNGTGYGPHVSQQTPLMSECSFSALLMELEAAYIVWRLFSGSVGKLYQMLRGCRSTMIMGSLPGTAKAATAYGYGNFWHTDSRDLGGFSWLIFYLLGKKDAIRGGTFYFPELGLSFQPGGNDAMYLSTRTVVHATTPSSSVPKGAARYVATAIYANSAAITGGGNYLQKSNEVERLILSPEKIDAEHREDPRVQAILKLCRKKRQT